MIFSAIGEATENKGLYITEHEFIMLYLKGRKPTIIFRNGDYC